MRTIFTALALLSPIVASSQPSPRLMQLGSVFQQESVQMQADVCARRFPTTATAWKEAAGNWTQRYAEDLSKLNASAMTLMSALEALPANARPLNLSELLALRAHSVMLVTYGLAGTPDPDASALCDRMRAALTDEARIRESLSIGQAAADEALRAVR